MLVILYGTVKGKNINNSITEKTKPVNLFENNIVKISIINILPSVLNGIKHNDIDKNQIQTLMNNIILYLLVNTIDNL
jgi:hypothetical protein